MFVLFVLYVSIKSKILNDKDAENQDDINQPDDNNPIDDPMNDNDNDAPNNNPENNRNKPDLDYPFDTKKVDEKPKIGLALPLLAFAVILSTLLGLIYCLLRSNKSNPSKTILDQGTNPLLQILSK